MDSSEGFGGDKPASQNPHIPTFVSKVPWYLKQEEESKATLDHQRKTKSSGSSKLASSNIEFRKGTAGDVKTKFVPGACENCGSTSHKRRDCLERPRKVLAKYSGDRLASDDVVPDDVTERTSFEAKRDRWRGFTATSSAVDQPSEKLEEKSKLKMSEEETFQMATSLRERSDVAKYLLHMDDDNKYYDPKSRSLRDTSSGGFEKAQPEGKEGLQKFAWES